MKRYTCYLSLGANLASAARPCARHCANSRSCRRRASSLSRPFTRQPRGGNSISRRSSMPRRPSRRRCCHGSCCMDASALSGHSRVRHEHWGARTIDIDLLHIPGVSLVSPELVLPHPYLTQRAFVLCPLADIAPDLIVEGRSVREWCRSVEGQAVSPAAELSHPWPLSVIACLDANRGIGYRASCSCTCLRT